MKYSKLGHLRNPQKCMENWRISGKKRDDTWNKSSKFQVPCAVLQLYKLGYPKQTKSVWRAHKVKFPNKDEILETWSHETRRNVQSVLPALETMELITGTAERCPLV